MSAAQYQSVRVILTSSRIITSQLCSLSDWRYLHKQGPKIVVNDTDSLPRSSGWFFHQSALVSLWRSATHEA